ncbi:hypothetical protein DDD_1920 [Nonlabens dokdonensis DSW-6]|uniref:Uncharacterized protein n=1 Tax=Nonlabens dokdonensis (strain DSM 17205 / KCTC 12402 / DSW-6) TaxID=592029 RepID=L7WDS5_NONDD|nr:hypothetical protein DDD_1920 [Nonlabens dokdonensis DSW-6]
MFLAHRIGQGLNPLYYKTVLVFGFERNQKTDYSIKVLIV